MKTAKTIMLVAIASLLLASCSNTKKAKTETESTDLRLNNNNTSGQAVIDDISSNDISESELDDGDEPMTAIYYKKLYTDMVISARYDGSIAELDYSLLDGYNFVGTLSTKFENYKQDGKWVMPDTDLTSNYFEQGDALLYNEEKDKFLVWSQNGNYWVTVTQFPDAEPAEQISEIKDEFPQYSAECFMENCSPEGSAKYAINDTEEKNRILSLYNEAVNESTEIEFDSDCDILVGGERLILSLTQEDGTVISVLLQADKNYDENKLSRGNILCCIPWVRLHNISRG